MYGLSFAYKIADTENIASLVTVINESFRGASSKLGWTSEADLLDGVRIDEASLRTLIEAPDDVILTACIDEEIVGCIHIHIENETVYFGLFAVRPKLQGRGIGKRLLREAERVCAQSFEAKKASMHVISVRRELISFYETCGYKLTGECVDFPGSSPLWSSKVGPLRMATMEKNL